MLIITLDFVPFFTAIPEIIGWTVTSILFDLTYFSNIRFICSSVICSYYSVIFTEFGCRCNFHFNTTVLTLTNHYCIIYNYSFLRLFTVLQLSLILLLLLLFQFFCLYFLIFIPFGLFDVSLFLFV